MSLFNSVLGSLSPPSKLRSSFEDPHARDHELPLYKTSSSPRIPPPVTASVLWSAPRTSLSPPPRVPDDLLALQRRARHLEQQLQDLLDAQAEGLTSGSSGVDTLPDDLISTGSITPTVSSVRSSDRSAENGTDNSSDAWKPRKEGVGLTAARTGISRRIRQLANVRAEELDLLDEDLREIQVVVEKTEAWTQKQARLTKKIKDIEREDAGAKTQSLQTEASKLEREIRQKEEELWALRRRHRRVLDELADTENSVEARLSSYKTSLSLLDREVDGFLARPPYINHVPLSSTPFLSLPIKRRTLEMAREYWQDELTRLVEKCEELDTDRNALDEGAVVWTDVVKKVADYEASLRRYLQHGGKRSPRDLVAQMDTTITILEEKLELATARSWNLLVCAIGAELEAFIQGKAVLMDALGIKNKGKEKASSSPLLFDDREQDYKEEMTGSAIRIVRSPPKASLPKLSPKPAPQKTPADLFVTDNDDPDPELMISHHDTDTD